MPANRVIESFYLGPFSTVEAYNSSTLYKAGELGARVITTANKEYQLVQVDSGATAAASSGVVASGQLAYWKNKSQYIVTNDSRFAVGGQTTSGWRNEVAGVFTVAAGAGNFAFIQTKGNNAAVKMASGSPNAGDQLVSDTSTTAAQGLIVTAGTAPVVQSLGKFAVTATTVTAGNVDLDIPDIP